MIKENIKNLIYIILVIVIFFAGLVAFSRVVTGAHFFTDIVGGIAVAVGGIAVDVASNLAGIDVVSIETEFLSPVLDKQLKIDK